VADLELPDDHGLLRIRKMWFLHAVGAAFEPRWSWLKATSSEDRLHGSSRSSTGLYRAFR